MQVPSKFSIDDGAFYMSVDKLVEETGLATKEILRLTGRHLVETALKVTPPHSGNMTMAHSEKGNQQKAKGLQNIRTDIQRVVGVLKELKLYQDPKIKKLVSKGELRVLSRIIGVTVAKTIPGGFHERFRNKRGRINKTTGKQLFVINKTERNKYVSKTAARLGRYKAGWNKAARRLKARGNKGWPAWVKRHSGRGYIKDKSSGFNFPRQEITIANLMDYASGRGATTRWMKYALDQSTDLMNRYFEKRLKYRMEKAFNKSGRKI